MEQNPASRPNGVFTSSAESSLVDSLFGMPESVTVKRMSAAERAEGAQLEARLAAQMRSIIAARLRGDEAA